MKTLFQIILLLATSIVCRAANPAFQDFYGTNGIVIRTNGNKVQVDGSALASTNGLANANIWTNEALYARLTGGTTNSLKVMTNGLMGIAIGDTNAMNDGYGWPYEGLMFVSWLDGSSGHQNNESVFGAGLSSGNQGIISFQARTDITDVSHAVRTNGTFATKSQLRVEANGGFLTIGSILDENNYVALKSGDVSPIGPTIGNNLMRARWYGQDRFIIGTNGDLTLMGVRYAPPPTQGASSSLLGNDGSGNLDWTTNVNELIITNLTVVNNTITSNLTVRGNLIVTNITLGGANVRTNQYTTNISGTPVSGSFWFQGTNGAPVTNVARVAMEWIPVMRSWRLGELGAQTAGPDIFDSTTAPSNYWAFTNVGFGSIAQGSNVMAKGNYSFIGNGIFNILHSNTVGAFIGAGSNNIIYTNNAFAVIGGGALNAIRMNSPYGVIGGGNENTLLGSSWATISGGFGHTLNGGSTSATIGGGSVNTIAASTTYGTIGGGRNNGLAGSDGTIAGGQAHSISGSSGTHNFIGGGFAHNINQSSVGATIAGGSDNDIGITAGGAGDYSFIGGGRTHRILAAAHYGTIGGGQENAIETSRTYGQILGGMSNDVNAVASTSIGNFITNTTTKSVEIGQGDAGGNNRKLRVDVNGAKVLTYGGAAAVGGTFLVTNTVVFNAGSSETNLQSVTIGANVLTNNQERILFRASGRFAATSNTKTIKVVYGSETIFDSTAGVANTGAWVLDGEIIRTGATAQSCNVNFNGGTNVVFVRTASQDAAQTNGIATVLKITGTASGDGDITNRTFTVEWAPTP